MKSAYHKLDKLFTIAPKRTINTYNSLISGILGGAVVYYLFLLKSLEKIAAGFWYVIVLWIIGWFAILRVNKDIKSKKSRKKQLANYHWNTLAAIIGGFYLSTILNYKNITVQILATLMLLILFMIIIRIRNKLKR